MLKKIIFFFSFILLSSPVSSQNNTDSMLIKHSKYYQALNSPNDNKRSKAQVIREQKIFCGTEANDEVNISDDMESGNQAIAWSMYAGNYRSKRRELGTISFQGITHSQIHLDDIRYFSGNNMRTSYQEGDTISLFYKKKFEKKNKWIYKEMRFVLQGTIPCVQNILNRKKSQVDSILTPPSIEIMKPATNATILYRCFNKDTIQWKTELKPPFVIKVYRDDKLQKDTLLYEYKQKKSEIVQDSIYSHVWSPKYDAFVNQKKWQDRNGYYYKDKVKIVILGKWNKETIQSAVTVIIKPFITFIKPKANSLSSPPSPFLYHRWKIEYNLPDSPLYSFLSLEIRKGESQRNDSLIYIKKINNRVKNFANDVTSISTIENQWERGRKDKNGRINANVEYNIIYFSKAYFEKDTSLCALSKKYYILERPHCTKFNCESKKKGKPKEYKYCLIKSVICNEITKKYDKFLKKLNNLRNKYKLKRKKNDDLPNSKYKSLLRNIADSDYFTKEHIFSLDYKIDLLFAYNKGGRKNMQNEITRELSTDSDSKPYGFIYCYPALSDSMIKSLKPLISREKIDSGIYTDPHLKSCLCQRLG